MKHATFAVLLAFVSIAGTSLGAATKPLTIAVSNETAPSGGTAQIKFFAVPPQQISSGELSIDLDPGFFSSIRIVAVFSTTGDAYGFAAVTGLHADVRFGSLTGGIGQSSGLPILTVTASVGAQAHSAIVSADPTGSAWRDPAGNVYSVTVTPGAMTAGGALSISDVVPGGGILSTGTPIQISGTGFSASTTVEIDAASVASVQIIGPQQIQLTLGAPTELSGKRIHVMNPDGSEVAYFPSLPSSPVTGTPPAPLAGLLPILPLETYRAAITSPASDDAVVVVALQNPNPAPVDILLHGLAPTSSVVTSTIPPNGWAFLSPGFGGQSASGSNVLASAPIRMMQLIDVVPPGAPPGTSLFLYATPVSATNAPPLQVNVGGGDSTVMWTWQAGTAPPPPQYISVSSDYKDAEEPAAYAVSVATESGGPWLLVSQKSGISCDDSPSCIPIAVIANPASLAPGNYRATITSHPSAPACVPTYFRRPSVSG